MNKASLMMHTGGMVSTNGYLLHVAGDYFVIDAPKGMYDFIKSEGIKPTALLLTHQHYDHVEDAGLFSKDEVPIYSYQHYSPPFIMTELAERWGFKIKIDPFTVTNEVKFKNLISVGNSSICTLHVPGHSPDSVVYYFPGKHFLFAGDTLFQGSIGRTDLPMGDHETLLEGIKEQLMVLDDEIEVFPGHGDLTTIGDERTYNPFIS